MQENNCSCNTDRLLDEIHALAHILQRLFEQVEDAQIKVNPHAVACFARIIAANTIKVIEHLDDNPHAS